MPTDETAFGLLGDLQFVFFARVLLIIFLVFYNVFAIILFRQIQIMCRTLPSGVAPYIRFLAIVHVGVSLAILLVILGTF